MFGFDLAWPGFDRSIASAACEAFGVTDSRSSTRRILRLSGGGVRSISSSELALKVEYFEAPLRGAGVTRVLVTVYPGPPSSCSRSLANALTRLPAGTP